MKQLALTCLMLVLLASPAWGGDLYVGAAATGDESGSGVGNLCTLATANASLSAGETAYLLDTGGNYVDQSIDPANNGSDGNPITYEAYTGDTPVLIGTGAYKATSHTGTTGFGIRALIHIGTNNDGRSYITIKGITVQEPNHRWFHVEDSDHIIFEDCIFDESLTTYTAYAKSAMHSSSYLYFDGCLWDGSNQTSGGFDNLGNYYSHHYVFTGCTFKEAAHSSFEDLSISEGASTCGVFKNCIVDNTWHSGATFGGRNAKYYLIEGCTFKNAGSAVNPFDPLDDATDPGLYTFFQRSIIRNNTFYNNNNSLDMRTSSPFGDWSYNWVYHNTIYGALRFDPPGCTHCPRIYTGTSLSSGSDDGLKLQYNHIINNIIWKTENPQQIVVWKDRYLGYDPSNNTIEYNVIGDPTNPSSIRWGGWYAAARTGTLYWQEQEANDGWANNLLDGGNNPVDPLMELPDSQDFTLKSNSPCKDAGRFLATIASTGGDVQLTLGANEAYAFFDGWGLDSNYVTADTIYDDDGYSATVVSIDAHNQITISGADRAQFTATDTITVVNYVGVAPDIGANEYRGEPQNHAPAITQMTPSGNISVASSATITLNCEAEDEDEDIITYSWLASGIEIYAVEDPGAVWQPADGTYILKLIISDGTLTDEQSVNVYVGGPSDTVVAIGGNIGDDYAATVDGYIRGGTNANTSYNGTLLLVKKGGSDTYTRESYIAFPTTDISGETATDAYVQFYVGTAPELSLNANFYIVVDDFTETATWNCAKDDNGDGSCDTEWTPTRGRGTLLDTVAITSSTSGWIQIEGATLDTYVATQVAAGNPVRVGIILDTTASQALNLYSLENSYDTQRPFLIVTYSGGVVEEPLGNDFTGDTGLIGWWELDDNTDSSGNSNTLDVSDGDPSYAGGGVVLDGDDSIERTNLSGDIADITIYTKFEFDNELAAVEMIMGEWDYGDNERVWALLLDDNGGDDEAIFRVAHTDGEAAQYGTLSHSYDLDNGTVYNGIGRYDTSEDDAWISMYLDSTGVEEDSTKTDAALLGGAAQYVTPTPFMVGAVLNSDAPALWLTGTIYEIALWNRVLSADEVAAVGSNQFPLAIIADEIAISAAATYGEDNTLVVALRLTRLDGPVDVTWTDGALPYDYLTCETGGTDLRLYHSFPASGVAGSEHWFSTHATDGDYVNSMIATGMNSADLVINSLSSSAGGTWTYGSPAINCDMTLPNDLAANAAIVIDTAGQTFGTLEHCDAAGDQVAGATTYTSGDFYLSLIGSASEYLQFKDGPSGDIVPTILLTHTPSSIPGTVYSGLDGTTDKTVFRFNLDNLPGAYTANAIMGESALPHSTTKVVDTSPAENEMTSYNYPNGTTIGGGAITINVPCALNWTLDTGGQGVAITGGSIQ